MTCIDSCTLTNSERSPCCFNNSRRQLLSELDDAKEVAKLDRAITWWAFTTLGLFLFVMRSCGSSIKGFDVKKAKEESKCMYPLPLVEFWVVVSNKGASLNDCVC